MLGEVSPGDYNIEGSRNNEIRRSHKVPNPAKIHHLKAHFEADSYCELEAIHYWDYRAVRAKLGSRWWKRDHAPQIDWAKEEARQFVKDIRRVT